MTLFQITVPLLLCLAGSVLEAEGLKSLNDGNIKKAVAEWFHEDVDAESKYGHISDWDVTSVTDFSGLFRDRSEFNEDLSKWKTPSAKDMEDMFREAEFFDSDLSSWDVSQVENLHGMFFGAKSFKGNGLSSWQTAKVKNMAGLFRGAEAFEGELSQWDTSKVNNTRFMFYGTKYFNSDIGGWDVSRVVDMDHMFNKAESFNQDLSSWDPSSANSVEGMFECAQAFDQKLCWKNLNTTAIGIESAFCGSQGSFDSSCVSAPSATCASDLDCDKVHTGTDEEKETDDSAGTSWKWNKMLAGLLLVGVALW